MKVNELIVASTCLSHLCTVYGLLAANRAMLMLLLAPGIILRVLRVLNQNLEMPSDTGMKCKYRGSSRGSFFFFFLFLYLFIYLLAIRNPNENWDFFFFDWLYNKATWPLPSSPITLCLTKKHYSDICFYPRERKKKLILENLNVIHTVNVFFF